jgi:hypothetical protein
LRAIASWWAALGVAHSISGAATVSSFARSTASTVQRALSLDRARPSAQWSDLRHADAAALRPGMAARDAADDGVVGEVDLAHAGIRRRSGAPARHAEIHAAFGDERADHLAVAGEQLDRPPPAARVGATIASSAEWLARGGPARPRAPGLRAVPVDDLGLLDQPPCLGVEGAAPPA